MLLYLSPPGISWTRSDLMVGTGIALCQMLHGICACVDVLANCSRCMYVCVRMYVLEAVSACVRMCACVVYISELGHTYCTFTYVPPTVHNECVYCSLSAAPLSVQIGLESPSMKYI